MTQTSKSQRPQNLLARLRDSRTSVSLLLLAIAAATPLAAPALGQSFYVDVIARIMIWAIAATSLTLPNDQEPFALNLFRNLQDPTITRIGDAFTQAKRAMPVDIASGLQEISDTFVLFGDPSALIVRPTP